MLRCLLNVKGQSGCATNADRIILSGVTSVHRAKRARLAHVLTSIVSNRSPKRAENGVANYRSYSSSTPDDHDRRGSPKAVKELLQFLSKDYKPPKSQTARDIKSLYISVRSNGYLKMLTPDSMSLLIRFFGSLSILADLTEKPLRVGNHEQGSYSLHPLATYLSQHSPSGAREYWSFVLTIAKDKQSHDQSLSDSDNYWLMRAALQDVKRLSIQKSQDEKAIKQHRERARTYYLRIKPEYHGWTLHTVYFEALLAHGDSQAPDEIIHRLGIISKQNGGLHWRLRDILWRVLALPGDPVLSVTKTTFLRVLRGKISKARDVLPCLSRLDNLEPASDDNEERRNTYDALAIRNYFVDILFSLKPGTHPRLRYLREIYPWALFEARAALHAFNDGTYTTSAEEDNAAWNNLILLSLSFSAARSERLETAGLPLGRSVDGCVQSQGQVLGWTVICALAALSAELRLHHGRTKPINMPLLDGIRDMSRTLWMLWRKEEVWRAGAVARTTVLVCSTTASFMALASVSQDDRLASILLRHVREVVIYPAQFGDEPLDPAMLEAFAVHYAVMIAAANKTDSLEYNWAIILSSLRAAQLIPEGNSQDARRWASVIGSGVLRECVRFNSRLAYELYKSTAKYGLLLDGSATLALGKRLASEKHLELALNCLEDIRLPQHSARELLDSILSNALHCHRRHFDRSLALAFAKVFTNTSIRPTNAGVLESVLRVCLRAGYLKEAYEITHIMDNSEPSMLRSQFLEHFVSTLVSHRHYRHLGGMMNSAWHRSSSRKSSAILRGPQFSYVRRLLAHTGSVSNRQVARSLPFSIHVWPSMRNYIPFHPRVPLLDKSLLFLRLSASLQRQANVDEKSLERAVHLLVSVGRITSALKLLDRFSPIISTKIGNIILSGSLRPRHSRRQYRQVRHASARLSQLVQKREFVPDRVTLNLVVKALLRWQTFIPKTKLRVLFDKFIMGGYPGSEMISTSSLSASTLDQHKTASPPPERGPFGTSASSKHSGLSLNLKAFPTQVSFKRHARPLYRMFVKAFRLRGDDEGARRVSGMLRGLKKKSRERASVARASSSCRAYEGAEQRASLESRGQGEIYAGSLCALNDGAGVGKCFL
ncbi:hypothetical protein EW145_g4079 [Phellinidium pouzarii]|uniref:Uncharacterized protein n=1 Tax=Phellinidium pouzarii TaxID=167371 RepID=A0A4S4L4V2_9AGAM|nr:hypothetical protein EW145_g4079 [Phellinidium pouzarii]